MTEGQEWFAGVTADRDVLKSSSPELYLDLLKRCITGSLVTEHYGLVGLVGSNLLQRVVYWPLRQLLQGRSLVLVRRVSRDEHGAGRDWPAVGETMIGMSRLNNLHECVREVIRSRIPGDLIETGVWRGGAAIFMRGVLAAYGESHRVVWVADSFVGLPPPDLEHYPEDRGDRHYLSRSLVVSLDEVKQNFAKYGLLDDQVRFLKGWFRDTLPAAPIERLALLRLDGDMYESTIDSLRNLYPKVSIGGFVVIDDYSNLAPCRKAVDDYRSANDITEPLKKVDWNGVYWRRAK